MRASIRKAWVERLRSGRDKQGRHRLATIRPMPEGDPVEEFCCLGVLCEMAREAGVDLRIRDVQISSDDYTGVRRYNDETGYLPVEVVKWAGISTDPIFGPGQDPQSPGILVKYNHFVHLATKNDSGEDFSMIAALIEKDEEATHDLPD